MYVVALSPSLVGSLAAFADTNRLDARLLFTFLFSAVALIAWVNLTNDVFDFDMGIDENKAESIVNLFGGTRRTRHYIFAIANLILLSGLYSISFLAAVDSTTFVFMLVDIALGLIYQAPPFRLSYLGLGEPICFTAWVLGVCAAYYTQLVSHPPTFDVIVTQYPTVPARIKFVLLHLLPDKHRSLLAAALLVAYPVSLVLFCSHFHQEFDDRAVGKLSPIVRLGVVRATRLLWFPVSYTHLTLPTILLV